MTALHIFWREFKSFYYSPIAYFVMLGMLLFNGFIFFLILSMFGERPEVPASLWPVVVLMAPYFFMVTTVGIVPMITMRLFSEEKRSGTIEALLTAPVTDFQIVVGKFFSAWAFYLTLWIPTLIYLGIVLMMVDSVSAVDLGIAWSSYIGMLLMSFAFVAVGTMFSSFSKSQILSFILTFSFLVVLFFIGYASGQVPNDTLQKILAYIGTHTYMEDFSKGMVDLKATVYFSSMAFLALFVTSMTLQARKWR